MHINETTIVSNAEPILSHLVLVAEDTTIKILSNQQPVYSVLS